MAEGEYYRSRTGLRVHRRWFETCTPAKAGAVFIHGLGEHGGRHDRHLNLFAQLGIQCAAIDLPGHGLTEGRRGHVPSLEIVMELIQENVEALRLQLGAERQVGVLGHSMGAFLGLCYLTRFPHSADFSWLSSPLIDPAAKASWLKRNLALLVDRVYPHFTLHSGITGKQCKRDQAEIAATRADKLVHRQMTVRLGSVLVRAARELLRSAHRAHSDLKMLMTHGGEDVICCPRASRHFFDRLPTESKQYALFEGLLHEPFNDVGKEVFYQRLEAWVTEALVPTLDEPSLHSRAVRDLGQAA